LGNGSSRDEELLPPASLRRLPGASVSDTYESRSRSRRDSLSGLRQLGKELRHPISAEKASGQATPPGPVAALTGGTAISVAGPVGH